MDQPLPAHSLNEVKFYLTVTACQACGAGPWITGPVTPPAGPEIAIHAHCHSCGQAREFAFRCETPASAETGDECINPTPDTSRLIDLRQWLSLFYMLIDEASRETSKPQSRIKGYRAALCLEEALKFYGDNELPPETAFFSPASVSAFREHSERFARQRLRDLRARLPSSSLMARNVANDARAGKPKWWQVWK